MNERIEGRDRLLHYFVPTGVTSRVEVDEVSPEITEQLVPKGKAEQQLISIQGCELGVGLFRDEANSAFGSHAVVFRGTRLIGVVTVALTQDIADELWRPFESHYLRFSDRGVANRADWASPKRPERAPWVASFPVDCEAAEQTLLPHIAGTWAMALSQIKLAPAKSVEKPSEG